MLKFHPLKVKARNEVAEDAVCITFELPPDLRNQFDFHAGQHIAVRLPEGDVRRTYSIVCPKGSSDLRIGVRQQPGGEVSNFLAQHLKIGETLEVLTPNGSFHTQIEPQRIKHYVAFAAGSGITPVLSIVATALALERNSRFILFYGNRTTASTMFVDEVLALKNRFPSRFSVHFVMSREPQDSELFNGRLDRVKVREFANVFFDAAGIDEFFICGPGSMVEEVSAALRELGTPGKIHTELFSTLERPAGMPRQQATSPTTDARGETQVTVVIDGRRRNFSMQRDGNESVLDAAARAGIDLPYSCTAGVCSTCRTRVVKGNVRMEYNLALEDWEVEAGYALCCQARPMTAELEISYDE